MISSKSKILEINNKLKKFNLKRAVVKSIKDNKEDLIILIKDQMRSGKDSEGMMDIYRSLDYAEEKRDLFSYVASYPHRDLFHTGKFQGGITLFASGNKWSFWSKDGKTQEIVDREGEQIFDLNPTGLELAQSIVQEDIKKQIINIFK